MNSSLTMTGTTRIEAIPSLTLIDPPPRAPQDGRISLSLSGRPIDFRVSTLPTVHGENIVLRVLDRQKGIVPLDGETMASAAEKLVAQGAVLSINHPVLDLGNACIGCAWMDAQ